MQTMQIYYKVVRVLRQVHQYRTHICVSGTTVSRTGGSGSGCGCAEHSVRSILSP